MSSNRFQENKWFLLWLKHHFYGSFPLKWLITIRLPFQPFTLSWKSWPSYQLWQKQTNKSNQTNQSETVCPKRTSPSCPLVRSVPQLEVKYIVLVSPEPQLSINVISEMFLNLMLCSFMATFREKVFKCSLVTSRPRRNTNMTSPVKLNGKIRPQALHSTSP